MTMPSANPVDTIGDRVQLPFFFDVEKMQQELASLDLDKFTYYDVLPLRSPAHMVDTSLPEPPPVLDYADGSWTEWMDTPILKNASYLSEVIDTFKEHTKVTLVRLLRLEAGAIVKEHTDPTLGIHIHKSVIRLTVPIITNDKVTFYLNNEPLNMKLGECWYLRLSDPHRITNEGETERINLTIDMIPNDWVRSMIKLNS